MTGMRAMDDAKRGYPTRVGPLVKMLLHHKMQAAVGLTQEDRAKMREALLASADRVWSDALGEQISALQALDALTPGQMTLLRSKVRVRR